MRTITSAVLFLLLVAGCGESSSSSGSSSAADLSTPKAAIKTLFQAMYDNQPDAAKACLVEGPGQAELGEGMTRMMSSMRRATDAAYKRFGDEFEKLAGGKIDTGKIDPRALDAATETIAGDTATVQLNNAKRKMFKLQRVGGQWKVDLRKSLMGEQANLDDPEMMNLMAKMFKATENAGDATAKEIEAGKYSDAKSAVEGMMANMKKAISDFAAKEIQSGRNPSR